MKVYIIGYMGVGKTTLGKKLAKALGLPFTDLDAEIARIENASIATIFAEKGETYFREKERDLLSAFAEKSGSGLLSTGGGAPVHFDNMDIMLNSGTVVWFTLVPGAIAARVIGSKEKRPILKGLSGEDLLRRITTHLAERSPYYSRAHLRFDTSDSNPQKITTLADAIRDHSK